MQKILRFKIMKIFDRRSIRLKGNDYAQPGAYFITICTENRQFIFGNIVKEKMVLNSCGGIVEKYCLITENHFQNIKFDVFVTMPNHFHAIIKIIDTNITHYNPVGAGSPRPNVNPNVYNGCPNVNDGHPDVINGYPNMNNTYPITNNAFHDAANKNRSVLNIIGNVSDDIGRGNPAPTLGQIVGFLKYGVSKNINQIRKTPGVKLWQRNFHDHIIRNNGELNIIREYIQNNPLNWKEDNLFTGSHL